MAWPYDARYKSFAANNEISSAFLNDVQDKMITNYSSKKKIFTESTIYDAADWSRNITGLPTWECIDVATATKIGFACHFQSGVNVTEIEAKIYNGDSSAATWTIDAYIADANFATPGDAPALGSVAATATDSGITATDWDIITTGAIDLDIGNDYVLYVYVGPPTHIDDVVYGVRVTYYPLG